MPDDTLLKLINQRNSICEEREQLFARAAELGRRIEVFDAQIFATNREGTEDD